MTESNNLSSQPVVDEYGNKRWLDAEGKLHREGAPAYESADGTKAWYLHGKFHREDGPAYVGADGSVGWYLEGRRLQKDEIAAQQRKHSRKPEVISAPQQSREQQRAAVLDDERYRAVARLDEKEFEAVVSMGLDPTAVSAGGSSVLHMLAEESMSAEGFGRRIDAIVRGGFSLDRQDGRGQTPLMVALICDHPKAAEYLLGKGADTASEDSSGKTAFDYAIECGYVAIAYKMPCQRQRSSKAARHDAIIAELQQQVEKMLNVGKRLPPTPKPGC